MKCPNCGFRNPDDESFCQACGADISRQPADRIPPVACPKCGELNLPEAANCRKCRASLVPAFVTCPSCARQNPTGGSRCLFCGSELPEEEMPARPEPLVLPAKAVREEITCPKCGGIMQPGFMLIQTAGRPVKWGEGPDNFWGTVGLPIVEGDLWTGRLSMQGYRCSTCRVLTIRY
jgi:predicted RNA-binding Zn-ribbon protein involved in translation (DUF1610 family)